MELRAFAERIVFGTSLEEKLQCPDVITDEQPGNSIIAPLVPGRPPALRMKSQGSAPGDFPGLHQLEREEERGKLLHFFANHELLATELMALALLRFPDAPASFRRGLLQTLKDEQVHTRLYLNRMEACGIQFGELPVSGYFWRGVSGMEHPIDYVAGLCLTFEQANLDFCRQFAKAFERVGDETTAALLGRIYRDEIGHVAYGLKWFRRWKSPELSDWEAFCRQLKFPLSPQRAKGPLLNVEGRSAAGFDPQFIAELNVYSKSKGRTPDVYVFNPYAEGHIALGKAFTPTKHQALLAHDLANLAQFLCRQDDVVLVPKKPSVGFLSEIKNAGFPLPEFVELPGGELPLDCELRRRKLGELRPWAWAPDSVELLAPLFAKSSEADRSPEAHFTPAIAALYSKGWSAAFLKGILCAWSKEEWLCPESDVGMEVNTIAEAVRVISAIRARGHHKVIAKEAHGLAGHNSLRLWEPEVLKNQLRWMERALENGRSLVVEPWLDREVDFSIQLEMGPNGLKLLGYTGLVNDHRGQFQANWAVPNRSRGIPAEVSHLFGDVRGFPEKMTEYYGQVFAALQKQLQQAGYAGPVGLDAFAYRTSQRALRLKPIVELNPRYTMGRLTLELMKHTAPGSFGVFRLINRGALRSAGFETFSDHGRARKRELPVLLAGEPVARIAQGLVCLNDPTVAEVVLATFRVGRSLKDIL